MTSHAPCISAPTASVEVVITSATSVSTFFPYTALFRSCPGTELTFTATPTNGGTTPTYQWKVNGVNIAGATSTTYKSTTLNREGTVSVVRNSNAPCISAPTARNEVVITTATSVTPSVSI